MNSIHYVYLIVTVGVHEQPGEGYYLLFIPQYVNYVGDLSACLRYVIYRSQKYNILCNI